MDNVANGLLKEVNEVKDVCHYCYNKNKDCKCNRCKDCARRYPYCVCGM